MAPLLLFLFFFSIFILLLNHYYYRLRFRLPPGPRPWPVFGNLYDIKPVRFCCFSEWAQSYGPIISVWFGSTLNVVVNNSELAKQVLKEKDQQLADRHRSQSAAMFSKDGQDLIWADYWPHYVKVRKVCTIELFSPKRLEALRPIREDEVTAMVESIYESSKTLQNDNVGKSLILKKYLGAVAFNNITRLAFGKRFMNSQGIIDKQGEEFKAIVANGLKLGAYPFLWLSTSHGSVGCSLWTRRHLSNMGSVGIVLHEIYGKSTPLLARQVEEPNNTLVFKRFLIF